MFAAPEVSKLPSFGEEDEAPDVPAVASEEAVDVSNSSSNSSPISSDRVNEEEFVERVMPDGLRKETLWELFQHNKSRFLHRRANCFVEGKSMTTNYLHLKEGASFRWARCAGCFKGEVLTKPEQMADALDALCAKRVR